jgi:PAS domain S-box-containing protein
VGLLLVSLTGKKVAQAHAALTESHDKARALFEYAADGIFVADLEGRYLEVNPVGAQMLGYSPAEMIGKSVTDLIPPGDIARLWRAREQLHTGSPQTEEWSLRRKDGTFVSVEVSARMLPDGRWQTFVRDISERKLAAELLRRSEARLSGLISISLDGILSIDQNQNIALFNQGAEAVFGWSQREVLGQPLEVLLPQRFRERHRRHVSDFGCGPEQTRLMHLRRLIWGLRKNGEEFPMEASISKLAADGGYLYTIIFRDISERVRLERTQQEHMAQQRLLSQLGPVLSASLDYEGVLNQLSNLLVRHVADICIALIIEDGEVRRLKAAHADPDKQEYADALSKIVLNPIHPHPVWQVIETGQPVLMREITDEGLKEFAQSEEHLALLRKANVCSVMVLPLRGRNTILGVLILDCCGDHRRYGAEDIHVGMEIAHRAALAVENAKLYQIAQQAIQARDALLEVVAHDLRNPLNTVQLSTELLKGPADKSQVIERIKHAVQRANTLVADLMDVSRMESGRMNLECGAVSSAQLVQDCVEAQKPASAAVPTELRMEIPAVLPTVWADSKRALQVFENLLGNALKFTPPGGTITVGGLERPTEVLFWVKDNGPGIPAHELPHLFDRFWQADKKDRRGSGLGLAIAKEIVEAHGGKIWAESVKQKGSCFWFTLPKAA